MTARGFSFSPGRNGVYRFAHEACDCEAVARSAGLAWLTVDLAGANDKARVLAAFAAQLEFPGHFGANWDALADCLQDLSWQPAHGYVVEVRSAGGLAAAAQGDCGIVLDILREAAMFWREQGKPFVVFVHGLSGLPSLPA